MNIFLRDKKTGGKNNTFYLPSFTFLAFVGRYAQKPSRLFHKSLLIILLVRMGGAVEGVEPVGDVVGDGAHMVEEGAEAVF